MLKGNRGLFISEATAGDARRHHELNPSEGLQLLLQAEQEQRSGKCFDHMLKNAGLHYRASVEELNMDPSRGIDRSLITDLAVGT